MDIFSIEVIDLLSFVNRFLRIAYDLLRRVFLHVLIEVILLVLRISRVCAKLFVSGKI